MEFEQDYVMRLIKQVIHALIGVLLNKKTTLEHEMLVNLQQNSGDDYIQRLTILADQGKICEAENMLLDALEGGTHETCLAALLFYEHINEFDDDFLEEHNFSRSEIRQGVIDIADRMKMYPVAASILDEETLDDMN